MVWERQKRVNDSGDCKFVAALQEKWPNLSSSLRSSARPLFVLCGLMLQTLGTTAEDAEEFAQDRRGNLKATTAV